MHSDSAHSGALRSGQPAWRRFVAVMLMALLSPIPALLAYWADASGDGINDVWVDPAYGTVFTLAELDAFSDDIDGDGLSNAQELQLGTDPFSSDSPIRYPDPGRQSPVNGLYWEHDALSDQDDDGINNFNDPAPYDAGNYSQANGTSWGYGGAAIEDYDRDGIVNFFDETPYVLDSDGDGYYDDVDPAPEDWSNTSQANGISWYANAFYDDDSDGVDNFDDPAPYDATNYSSYNDRYWYGSEVLGDFDNDGRLNFFDRHPEDFYDGNPPVTDPDSDGDGLADSADPAKDDPYNVSPRNHLPWPGGSANEDADGDLISNFDDLEPYTKLPEPEPGPSCFCSWPSAPSVSASTFVLLNDNFDELTGPWTPESKRDYQTDKLFGKDAEGNSRIVIEGLMPLAISLPDGYANGQRSIVIRQSGVGEVRIHAVRGNEEDCVYSNGMAVVLKQGDGWQYWVEGTRAGQVMLEYEFPESAEYREANRPGGCASSDCLYAYYDWSLTEPATNKKGELTLQVVPAEVVVRKKTEAAAPETGLLVKKGDVITFDVNGSAPAAEFPFPPESVKWRIRQLKHDGTTTEWADVQGQGAEVDYMTNQGGVFEAKAVVTPSGGKASDYPLTRKKDAPYSSDSKGAEQVMHKAGAVDYFGVADQQWQIDLREKALADLGSEKYKTNGVFNAPWFPYTTYKNTVNKCNIFVYHKCIDAGLKVSLVRGGSEWLGFRTSPPLAIDWWNDNSLGKKDMSGNIITTIDIPNWSRLPDDAMPQPGFVVARPVLGGFAEQYGSHVGIFDYDGSWISAGASKVNKYYHPKTLLYQPQAMRKYNEGN
jgi:hypothetical protein